MINPCNTDPSPPQPELLHYHAKWNEVVLEVVFGTPSRRCDGIGICIMTEAKYIAGVATKCPHFPGCFSKGAGPGEIIARFPKIYLSSQMIARHFQMGLFKVTEPYKVPARILKLLGLKGPLEIRPGGYRVVETMGSLVVVFKM